MTILTEVNTMATFQPQHGVGSMRIPSNISTHGSIARGFQFGEKIPIEAAQIGYIEEKWLPTNGTHSDPFEFVIPASHTHWLLLNSLYLDVHFQIYQEDGIIAQRPEVGPVNLMLQSLWKRIETKINDIPINPTSATGIAHKAYLSAVLSLEGDDAQQNNAVSGQLFYLDTPDKYDEIDENKNKGWKKRIYAGFKGMGNGFDYFLAGAPYVDFLQADKHFAPGNKLTLTFHQNSSKFALLCSTEFKYKIVIKRLELYGRRMVLEPSIHQKILSQNSVFNYTCQHTELREIHMPKGSKEGSYRINHGGPFHKQILLVQVATEALVGDFKRNPFYFRNYKLNYLEIKENQKSYPTEPFTPDYTTGDYMRTYLSLFQNTGKWRKNAGNCVSHRQFRDSMNIYANYRTPDMCLGSHLHVGKDGTIDVIIKREEALPENVTLLVFMIRDQIISINRDTGLPFISVV